MQARTYSRPLPDSYTQTLHLYTNSAIQRSVLNTGKFMPMKESAQYKFVINVDGHSQANRFPFLLHFGPIVLQVLFL
jgi:hypothetical protein